MRLLKTLFVLVLLAAGVVAFYLLWPYGPTSETFVDIAPGSGTPHMAMQLQQAGVIRSRFAFEAVRLWERTRPAPENGSLKAGVYRFDHPATLTEVYARLRRGDVYTKTVVIPEGYNIFDIAAVVQEAGLASSADFLKAERENTSLIAQWSPGATSLEGYLFPDTYRFSPHTTPAQMVAVMVKRFDQMAAKLGLNGDVARTVTMASLVEKEVRLGSERPLVASTFENRLAAGMPLQTDPSVIYASLLAGTWTGVIHQSELHSDGTYNTYTHAGLTPGPICNPGVSALKAAMHPPKTDYLYFVADANGATRFAVSLTEHEANVQAYRHAAHQ